MRAKRNAVKDTAKTLQKVEPKKKEASIKEIVPPFIPVENEGATGAFEIAPGMTAEQMKALFFDEKTLIEPPYKVWQLNSSTGRYYYTFEDNGPVFYPSVTTILSQTMPKSEFLVKWVASMGYDEAERYKAERAAYGTFMHAQFESLLINRLYNLDELKDKLKEYIIQQRLPDNFIHYCDDLKKDILSFAQFVVDYDVQPLAVEIALVHPDLKYAGMIDLPCRMRAKIGSDERINAIVDFKSGRKNFYEDHELQLAFYRELWNRNFPETQITRIFNFSPKDWRKKPTYNLKEQTKSPNIAKMPYLLEIAAINDEKAENIFTAISGVISLDEVSTLTACVTTLTLSEIVKNKTK